MHYHVFTHVFQINEGLLSEVLYACNSFISHRLAGYIAEFELEFAIGVRHLNLNFSILLLHVYVLAKSINMWIILSGIITKYGGGEIYLSYCVFTFTFSSIWLALSLIAVNSTQLEFI